MKKEEVGELFHKHLHSEAGATDPQYLAEAARQHLRHKFMEADAGLTGVNFAIAETGGFVVCTNEGNADLGVSLPKLHIACMGIEKLIPRAKDLGVFLRLLARSATGQPITTYSSHFHGPRPGGELHIVLVDNGRSELLGSERIPPLAQLHSLRGVHEHLPGLSPQRRVQLRKHGARADRLDPGAGPRSEEVLLRLPFACSLCGSCTDVCPVKIDLHHQLLTWRRVLAAQGNVPWSKRMSMKIAGFVLRMTWLYRLSGWLARRIMPWLPRFMIYNRFNAWGRQRELPPMPRRSFREQYRQRWGRGKVSG